MSFYRPFTVPVYHNERELCNLEQGKTNALATEPVGRLLVKLALPAVTAQIINVFYNIVDRIYIGQMADVGSLALTGLGVCMPLILLISASAALVSMGSAPRASIKMGAKEHKEAEAILGNSTVLLLILSVLLTAAMLLFGKPLLLLFGASDNTIGFAWDYMKIYAVGTVFVQLSLGLNAFITTQGFATTSMFTVLIGAGLNIVLDPIFIFGLGMGVQGAALATILSQAVSALWVLRFLTGKKPVLRLRREILRLQPKVILPCLALGLSPFIMQSTESLISICFNSSLLQYGGDLAVGAMAVLSSVMQFSMLPLTGLAQGAQPIISYNFGARNSDRIRRAFRLLIISSLVYALTLWALIMLFPEGFASLFGKDPEFVAYTAWALRIYMLFSGLFSIQLACQQTFLATGNAKTSLFMAVLRKIIVLIPLIYILPNFFDNKVFGVLLAEPVADFVAIVTTTSLFAVYFRKILRNMEGEKKEQAQLSGGAEP